MSWWQFALLGAGGGVIVEVLSVFRWVRAWQDSRRGPDGSLEEKPSRLSRYLDIPAHAIMLPARAALGAVAAVVFGLTHQVTGPYGALAFGCVAPVVLARVGLIPQVADAINSEPVSADPQPAPLPSQPGPAAVEFGGGGGSRS
jgi:hypothetical protein